MSFDICLVSCPNLCVTSRRKKEEKKNHTHTQQCNLLIFLYASPEQLQLEAGWSLPI